jgi:hypothetical protein
MVRETPSCLASIDVGRHMVLVRRTLGPEICAPWLNGGGKPQAAHVRWGQLTFTVLLLYSLLRQIGRANIPAWQSNVRSAGRLQTKAQTTRNSSTWPRVVT